MRPVSLLLGVVGVACVVGAACTRSTLDLGDTVVTSAPPPTSAATSATPVPTQTAFGLGDGHDGAFAPTAADTKINTCHRVTLATNQTITVDDATGFAAGKYLLMQVQDDFSTESSAAPVTSAGDAGRWELAAVSSIAGTTLTVTLPAALSHRYDSTGTRAAQVCRMPEYTTVTIGNGIQLSATPWDGKTGGVLAFFASGAVTLNGTGKLAVSATGFRGGALGVSTGDGQITTEDTTANDGGGKGEGADGRALGNFGRGNYANGAGGGDSRDSGGGGGGGGGAGGFGGKGATGVGTSTDASRGRGGTAMSIVASQRLFLGGGGGAGHQSDGIGTVGANGGGLVLLFIGSLAGNGTIAADGGRAADSGDVANTAHDGAGGGGGGGTIAIFANASTFTGTISAVGGRGGDSDGSDPNDHGPGGGGGGGRIAAAGVAGTKTVAPGANGINGLSTSPNDATAGSAGVVE